MIKKIGTIAATGALLASAVLPAFASSPSLSGLNASINFGASRSAAAANTGGNVQHVSGANNTPEYSRSHKGHSYDHNRNSDSVNVDMRTGQATALSDSYVGIESTTNGGSGSQSNHYDRHSRGGSNGTSGLNISANIGLSESAAAANSGANVQDVTGRGETDVQMRTGDADATSTSTVLITSATNVSRSRSH